LPSIERVAEIFISVIREVGAVPGDRRPATGHRAGRMRPGDEQAPEPGATADRDLGAGRVGVA
jgi:hypothetical protein